jgi:hypothetical protein
MNLDLEILQEQLCKAMCAQIQIRQKTATLLAIDTPFTFSDGDQYQLYVKELMPAGVLRITDNGHTMMHLSYENEVKDFREGTRGKLFAQILAQFEVNEVDGEFYIDTTSSELVPAIFRLGQAITKLTDLTFLNRVRVEATFYEDLDERLRLIISDPSKVIKNYINPDLSQAKDYPIDYFIEGKTSPLYLFGIAGRDKAKLTTIILEHLLNASINFESLLVFMDQSAIPKSDLARLSNVGGEMISSLDAYEDMKRKIERKALLN